MDGLSLNRPQSEKYGITDVDWKTLMILGAYMPPVDKDAEGNPIYAPVKVEETLQNWISAGKINQYQARDIINELYRRMDVAGYQAVYGETAEQRATRLGEGLAKRGQIYAGATPEEMEAILAEQERQASMASWIGAKPETRYDIGLESLRAGFGRDIAQTETWMDWFRSKYPRIVEQFEAKVPEFKMESYPGLTEPEAQKKREKSWAEYLRQVRPQLKREWYNLSAYQRGERPSAYAPRVQTVRF